MTIDVTFRKNNLIINGRPMKFDFEVGNAFVVDNKIIFLLLIPNGNPTVQNIYCLDENLQFMWQAQSMLEAYPQVGEELPYENMAIRANGNISASDFFGRNFDIDVTNGKLVDFKIAR